MAKARITEPLKGTSRIDELERLLNSDEPHAVEIMPNGEVRAMPAILEFGTGKFVVDTGIYEGRPAVFIADALKPGAVGAYAKCENRNFLQPRERVLTFPTDEQAKAVADALCNVI